MGTTINAAGGPKVLPQNTTDTTHPQNAQPQGAGALPNQAALPNQGAAPNQGALPNQAALPNQGAAPNQGAQPQAAQPQAAQPQAAQPQAAQPQAAQPQAAQPQAAQPQAAQPQAAQPAQVQAPNAALTIARPTTDTIACAPRPACFPQPVLPAPGCIPPPSIDLSGAPAGRGLQTNPEGWPANSVRTAGGYHIVPDGGAQWRIFAPGQAATDTANTRVWGDPHVEEKDGTKWDFTKASDFVLGDGTRIYARTSAETGQSVSVGLEIVNGADRVSISDLDKQAKIANVSQDGYEWRAAHIAGNPNRDTFHLRGDQNTVNWVRERNGRLDGVVTGATFDKAQNRYEQTVDGNPYVPLDASMRPPFGSRAWGNQLRSEINDRQAKFYGQYAEAIGAPGAGVGAAVANAQGIHADHNRGAFFSDLRDLRQQYFNNFFQGGWGGGWNGGDIGWGGGWNAGNGNWGFGGWGSYFSNFDRVYQALQHFRQLCQYDNTWQQQYQLRSTPNIFI